MAVSSVALREEDTESGAWCSNSQGPGIGQLRYGGQPLEATGSTSTADT